MEVNLNFQGDHQEDGIENSLNSQNVERYHKRLEIYRTHSKDCKVRVDQSIDHIHEQQMNEISLLQNKTHEQKKKRVSRKGLAKQNEHYSSLMKTQQPVCQSSHQIAPTAENLTQCTDIYFRKFENSQHNLYDQHQQCIQPSFTTDVRIKQENQQLFYSPENEFEDLDFNGMAKLMNQQVGPELLKFDEQVPSFSLHQYVQTTDDQKRYKNIYINPNYIP